jgi:Uma2 family endonuclease
MINEPQPDVLLLIDPACGGQARISEDDHVEQAPELVAEVSASTVSIDLNKKLEVYRRCGVREYVVWRVSDDAIDWFVLRDEEDQRLAAGPDGIHRGEAFPGLWLDAQALARRDMARVLEVARQGTTSAEHVAFVARLAARRAQARGGPCACYSDHGCPCPCGSEPMTTTTLGTPATAIPPTQTLIPYRFSVEDYHKMIELGILREGGPVELIEGIVVRTMSQNPSHKIAVRRSARRIESIAGTGWQVWSQAPVTLSSSEPEPDVTVSRGDETTYAARHPAPPDIGLLVEVSDSTLDYDRTVKAQMYARDNVAEYWIVNIPDRQVEVYTQPSGAAAAPAYGNSQIYRAGSSVPLTLDGVLVGQIPVGELLP